MKYFHIDTDSQHRANWKPLCVHQEFNAGKNLNPIFSNWIKSATRIEDNITETDVKINFSIMLRESVFENIRLVKNPDLPSRKNCIWLCDSEAHARDWLSRIPHNGMRRMLELEQLDGSLHKVYEQHLTNNPENIIELEERATNYWSGHGFGRYELLATGHFRVTRVLPV
ncbi:DUF2441 domain-containing protein [Xanthomonas phaseoli]|uniref:DUF2441 domain-containing protein n=1 Tax=Xanthomonas phaseoli TaxID=1985254 RepID=UPI0009B6F5C8|nr:DUF2441 domain-containing protein [Xanthomonas phaseoli]